MRGGHRGEDGKRIFQNKFNIYTLPSPSHFLWSAVHAHRVTLNGYEIRNVSTITNVMNF